MFVCTLSIHYSTLLYAHSEKMILLIASGFLNNTQFVTQRQAEREQMDVSLNVQ